MERGNQPNQKNGVFIFLKITLASKQKTRTDVGNARAGWRQLRAEKGIKTEQELANSLRLLVFHLPYVNVQSIQFDDRINECSLYGRFRFLGRYLGETMWLTLAN